CGKGSKSGVMEWPAYLDEYEKLVIRMNTPKNEISLTQCNDHLSHLLYCCRVVIDNAVCPTATLVKVDSASRNHGVLFEAIHVLTDLNLSVKKAYISSDGRWFMDVFHVTDPFGNKLTDDSVISYLEQLTGTDRPGLLSEVFAVLADLQCDVVEATVWTHNDRVACILFLKDQLSGSPLDDAQRIHRIESRLRHVLKGDHGVRSGKTAVTSMAVAHPDSRLHQLMLADRDYERGSSAPASSTFVSVQNWDERGYSVVNVQCRDRPKLLFDIVWTLTDMQYAVFHGTIDTDGDSAHQGTRLELCIEDRPGLLSDVTRTFRENGLLVTRAEASTKGDMASDVFYVTDAAGQAADAKAIEAVRLRIGFDHLKVKEEQRPRFCRKESTDREASPGGVGTGLFYLGSLVRRNLYNLGLIKSCS
ncbi:hypothetical protein BHM03_00033924, partial [Ensete ventricosum]